jgi:hypothetical protein
MVSIEMGFPLISHAATLSVSGGGGGGGGGGSGVQSDLKSMAR